MSVESVLFTRLSTFPGLTALVGQRIYPNQGPDKPTLPYVTYRRVSSERPSAMGVDVGIVRARFQFDAWADTFDGASAVREQIRAALQRWRSATGTVVQDTYFLTDMDLYEEDTRLHHLVADFEINYVEA